MKIKYQLFHRIFKKVFWQDGTLNRGKWNTVAIYGTGNEALNAFRALDRTSKVLFFISEIPEIQNTTIHDLPVISPDSFQSSSAKNIMIADPKPRFARQQLCQLGVNPDRISIFSSNK